MQNRIEWLDGWRTVAVFIVILSHLGHAYDDVPWLPAIYGKFGVYIFFAISGYIVTKLLVEEHRKHQTINLPNFFIRRSLRILPPLMIYLFTCKLILFRGIPWLELLRSLFFTCNIEIGLGDCRWIFGHTWSLAFEEQFYLILPFVLILILERKMHFMAALSVAIAIIPFIFPVHFIGKIGFIQVYGLLLAGALYAINEKRALPLMKKIPASLSLILFILSYAWHALETSMLQGILGLFVPIFVAVPIFSLPLTSSISHKVLSAPPVCTLGLFSYTLYLWQQAALTNAEWNVGFIPLALLLMALGFSALSHYTIEAWCRRLSRRFRPEHSAQ